MKDLSRRNLLILGLSSAAATGCSRLAYRVQGDDLPDSIEMPDSDVHPTVRLLNRAGFGPRPGQISEVERMGSDAYVRQQLNPTDDEPLALKLQLSRIAALRIDGMELRDEPEEEVLRQLQQAALLRATYSPWQLRERMADFWTNHFNIYARKGLSAYRKGADDTEVIRKHALGSFPELLRASTRSPAMLGYLDNQVNRAGIPNENYARELMELHSLGVGGGYTQTDVQEVARCFTGWTIENRFLHHHGSLRFDPDAHDNGTKFVLGQRIPPGLGERDVDVVVGLLTQHSSTARFIANKLSRNFLGAEMPRWVDRLATIYKDTDGSIRAMIEPLLGSSELRDGPAIAKRPLDFVVSALRSYDAQSDCGIGVQQYLREMGQPLFEWPMPDGYPMRTSSWTGSLLARWNFALALTSNRLQGTVIDFERLASKSRHLNITELAYGAPSRVADLASSRESQAALALCSPEFQWR